MRGFTQEELAQKCEEVSEKSVSARDISIWENSPNLSDRKLKLDSLQILSEALSVPIASLVDERDIKSLSKTEQKLLQQIQASNISSANIGVAKDLSVRQRMIDASNISVTHSLSMPGAILGSEEMHSLFLRIKDNARAHLHINSVELFNDTIQLRNKVISMLNNNCSHKEKTDLFLYSGILSCLLSDTCMSAGAFVTAIELAHAAFRYGQQSGHDGLRYWARAHMESYINYSKGQNQSALTVLRNSFKYASSSTSKLHFYNTEALYCASLGRFKESKDAIDKVKDFSGILGNNDLFYDELQGMFGLPTEKWLLSSANAFLSLHEYSKAEELASESLKIYTGNPIKKRAFGNESLGRIIQAHSRLFGEHDLDGAEEALKPVFELEETHRQAWFIKRLKDFQNAASLEKSSLGQSGGMLLDQISTYISEADNKENSLITYTNGKNKNFLE